MLIDLLILCLDTDQDHHGDVTGATCCLQSPATGLFAHQLVQTESKKILKLRIADPWCGLMNFLYTIRKSKDRVYGKWKYKILKLFERWKYKYNKLIYFLDDNTYQQELSIVIFTPQ